MHWTHDALMAVDDGDMPISTASPSSPTPPHLHPRADHAQHRCRGHDIDLDATPDDDTVTALRQALVRHKVLVFRDQPITPAAHVALARRFGELEVHPVFPHHPDHPSWCCSVAMRPPKRARTSTTATCPGGQTPSMASLLRCVECPAAGGDTIWVNMALAYDNLPDR